ncbi:MAG: hypothetical protein LUH55_14515, partial [Bacteroides thetaiotaomicron]|nr:hypothetical protein [Bacteroides thetaiotaomicron]
MEKDIMLFVCETDAQLFNAINIKLNIFPMKDADVCIVDTAKNREKISNRIKQYGIFKNVYRVLAHRDTKQTFTAKLRKALSYISQTKLWENIPNKEMNYSDIFIAGPSMNCIKVYYYFREINPDIKLHLYEEGVFEYYMFAYKQNPVRRLYSKVIFGCYYLDNASDIYVYSENMMLKKPDNVELKVIPMVSKNNEDLRRIENAVFDFSYEGLETFGECRFLFLEQFFPNQKEQEAQM